MAIVGSWTYADGGGPMLWIDGEGLDDHVRLTLGTGIKNYLDGGHIHGDHLNGGEWHHVAGTYDGTTARLYVDKQLVASKPWTANVGDSNSWRIGSYGADGSFGYFEGEIDGVAIYSRALAVDELAATANG
jgi:hypothetical protein